MQDPNRDSDILNIEASVTIPFYLEDTLFVPDPFFLGYNSSPLLHLPPIDETPGFYSYRVVAEFAVSLSEGGVPLNEFQSFPSQQMCDDYEVGVEENVEEREFTIYPNPGQDFVFVELEMAAQTQVFSQDGKLIYSQQLTAGTNRIDISQLSIGVYVVNVFDGVSATSQTLIVE